MLALQPPPVRHQKDGFLQSLGTVYPLHHSVACSMALVSTVLGFDLVEFWLEREDGTFHCVHVHSEETMWMKDPNTKSQEHCLSSSLCRLARESQSKFIWRDCDGPLASPHVSTSMRTQVALMIQRETGGVHMFIIGFSKEKISFRASKIKFLTGLGFAICVAAFDLDENETDEVINDVSDNESDDESYIPPDVHDAGSETTTSDLSEEISSEVASLYYSSASSASTLERDQANRLLSLGPTWEPLNSFSFPVAEIPCKSLMANNMSLEDFTEMVHVADGSNSNIYLAKLRGEKVIVKVIKEAVQRHHIAVHEFDVEHGLLGRLSHPNIIRLIGAGNIPRRFIVLEYLDGGSLSSVLYKTQAQRGPSSGLAFRKPTFTFANLLSKARDMASALNFLHSQCHPGATIIHRDLKPDNIGFTSTGVLKLFDFGLCALVKRRSEDNEAYDMTGNTGSVRYMAPEVILRQPYTEKVDVYSFGIMVWQMARDRVPFNGMSKPEVLKAIVCGGERPKLDKAWPSGFSALLTSCWERDFLRRPSFAMIVMELDKLIADLGGRVGYHHQIVSAP